MRLAFSLWNIGEILDALNKARHLNRISEEDYARARRAFLFLSETRRLARLGLAMIVPLRSSILVDSWRLLERHHIYQADALQIASAKYVHAAQFLVADERLYEVARSEGLNSLCLG